MFNKEIDDRNSGFDAETDHQYGGVALGKKSWNGHWKFARTLLK